MSLAERLAYGIAVLDLAIDEATQRRLLDYSALIVEWNEVHHVTAGHDGDQAIGNHLLDCVAVLPHLAPGTIADVGSGLGIPGIPLVLAWPQHAVTLIESHHRKSAFLRKAVSELRLTNVEVVGEPLENWLGRHAFDTVISRAVCELDAFARLAGHLCAPSGTLAAMKVVYPDEELTQIPAAFKLREVIPVNIPGVRAGHHLVLLDSLG